MANEALGRGKVKIFPEETLKKEFLKIYLLGILIGCMLGLTTGNVLLMLAVVVFGLGAIVVIVLEPESSSPS